MSEVAKNVDLHTEAEIGWWQDAHAMVESKRLRQEQVMRDALQQLDAAWDEESFEKAWGRFQKARRLLAKELKKVDS